MTTQILFIRHGETDWNRIKRIQGHIDIPLAATGVAQAEQLARRVCVRESKAGARLDAMYSSDLQRAQQTAQAVRRCARLAVAAERRFARAVVRRRSRAMTAKRSREVSRRIRALANPRSGFRAAWRRIAASVLSSRAACGRADRGRASGWADRVRRAWWRAGLHVPVRVRLAARCAARLALLNTSINVVDYDDGASKAYVSWGDVAHLDPAATTT